MSKENKKKVLVSTLILIVWSVIASQVSVPKLEKADETPIIIRGVMVSN